MKFKNSIEEIKYSVSLVNDSLKINGNENISDTLLISNLNHLLNAANNISSELNKRSINKNN